MRVGNFVGVAALGVSLAMAATGCRGAERQPATPAGQGEPLFKGVEPAAPPVVPQAGPQTAKFPPATMPDGTIAAPMAMVTDLASGWPVTLQVGQSMTARLTADRAAGGGWLLRAGSEGGVLRVEGEPAYESEAGAAGVEVFQLEAVKAGKTTLTFDLTKGRGAQPTRSVSYPITVQ